MNVTKFVWLQEFVDQGVTMKRAGDGRTRGSKAYRDHTGRLREYFAAAVLSTGQHFARLQIRGNEMGDVVLDRPPAWLKPGHVVLVGMPHLEAGRQKISGVWPLKVYESEAEKVTGTIYRVLSPKYGFARADKNGREVRVDVEQLQHGATLTEGLRVTYVELLGDRGWKAAEVRPLDEGGPRSGTFTRNGRSYMTAY